MGWVEAEIFDFKERFDPLRCLNKGNSTIVKYIDRTMSKAAYDKLDDGPFSGKIPQCPGVIAFGATLYQCEHELKASLEGWLIVNMK